VHHHTAAVQRDVPVPDRLLHELRGLMGPVLGTYDPPLTIAAVVLDSSMVLYDTSITGHCGTCGCTAQPPHAVDAEDDSEQQLLLLQACV
jgi:hypothetical protein